MLISLLKRIFHRSSKVTEAGQFRKRDLSKHITRILSARYDEKGPLSLLEPDLVIVLVNADDLSNVRLIDDDATSFAATVQVRELPTVLSFLIIRESEIAIPRDILPSIAMEAASAIFRKLNPVEAR